MSSTFCNHIQKSLFVSHQGVGVCCVGEKKYLNIAPSEFWNGEIRKTALRQMNNNLPVDGCSGCYNTEKKNIPSTRNLAKSYDRIPSKQLPTLLDVDFSNFCNLKCVMCNPTRSSEWAKTVGLPVSKITYALIDDLLSISECVEYIIVQGGEPSIMPEYEYFFEKLKEKGYAQKIDLQIITNVTNINKKFYRLLETFKSVRLNVSIDAYGTANDYIRWPSNFDQITKNVKAISDLQNNVQVDILSSLNILSMFDYHKFLSWCHDMEKIFESKGKTIRMVPMKVEHPKEYSPFSAPSSLKQKFINDVKGFMDKHSLEHNSLWKLEMQLLLRSIENSTVDNDAISKLMHNISQLDTKRNTKITNYIPDFHKYLVKI